MNPSTEDKPWLTDRKYGGMSEQAAERSYRAAKETSSSTDERYDVGEVPASKSINYGVSADSVLDYSLSTAQDRHNWREFKITPLSEIKYDGSSRYIIKGIIPTVGIVVVWGPPKCGKTFLVLDLAVHVAAGWPYRNRRVKQTPVLYCAFEGAEGIVARLEAFRRECKIDDIPFHLLTERLDLNLNKTELVRSIWKQMHGSQPGLIVLDTLNRSIGGSENDSSDMGAYITAADLLRETFSCTVIIVHHCGVEGARPRGHTSLSGAADAQTAVRSHGKAGLIATVEFMKDGPAETEIACQLEQRVIGTDEDGENITSCVVQHLDASPAARPKIAGREELAFKLLQQLIAAEGEIPAASDHIPAGIPTVKDASWRLQFYDAISRNVTKVTAQERAFSRARAALMEKQLIGRWGDTVWLLRTEPDMDRTCPSVSDNGPPQTDRTPPFRGVPVSEAMEGARPFLRTTP